MKLQLIRFCGRQSEMLQGYTSYYVPISLHPCSRANSLLPGDWRRVSGRGREGGGGCREREGEREREREGERASTGGGGEQSITSFRQFAASPRILHRQQLGGILFFLHHSLTHRSFLLHGSARLGSTRTHKGREDIKSHFCCRTPSAHVFQDERGECATRKSCLMQLLDLFLRAAVSLSLSLSFFSLSHSITHLYGCCVKPSLISPHTPALHPCPSKPRTPHPRCMR